VNVERFDVRGSTWMDHEFGTSFLEKSQRGWDWLSLQLDDGTDIMLYQFRRADGSIDPHSSGTLVAKNGAYRPLALREFTLVPGRQWKSSTTSGAYPVEWQVTLPGEGLDLAVRAVVDGQEMVGTRSNVNYWEGAVDVEGTRSGRPIAGRGYLEMTGYSGKVLGELLQ
jgi:predicted secreted hydrolase